MAFLETQRKIINLGKSLVATLQGGDEVDTLSRWMAYYIAEQIDAVERSSGEEKSAAQERCFDAILKLWKHRAMMPSGYRPFEGFDQILRTLDRIDPDDPRPYYGVWNQLWGDADEEKSKTVVGQLLRFVEEADRAARIVIQFLLSVAGQECSDDITSSLLKNAVGEEDKMYDVAAYRRILEGEALAVLDDRKSKIGALQRKLAHLKRFIVQSIRVHKLLAEEIAKLEATT